MKADMINYKTVEYLDIVGKDARNILEATEKPFLDRLWSCLSFNFTKDIKVLQNVGRQQSKDYKFCRKVINNRNVKLSLDLKSSLRKVSNTWGGLFTAKMVNSWISLLTRIENVVVTALTVLGSAISLVLGGPAGFVPVAIVHLILAAPFALLRLGVSEATRMYMQGQARDLLEDVTEAKMHIKSLEDKKVALVQPLESEKKVV